MNGWGWTAMTILVALLAVNFWYYIEKVWELNRKHQRHLEEMRTEYLIQEQMLKSLTLPMMGVNNGS